MRENEERLAALLATIPRSGPTTSAPPTPSSPLGREPRFLQTRPDRDRTDGFFIARLRRDAATHGSPKGG